MISSGRLPFWAMGLLGPLIVTSVHAKHSGTGDVDMGGPQPLHRVELSIGLGAGDGRLVVKAIPLPGEARRQVAIVGAEGTRLAVRADQREHAIRVPASFPKVALLKVDSTAVLVAFRKQENVYFVSNPETGWTLVSSRTDPRMGSSPSVVCVAANESCPTDYVMSSDPPLSRDTRCPDPTHANSKTAKLCYLPGRVMFNADKQHTVELLDKTVSGPRVLRTVEIGAGVKPESVAIDYERQRPIAVRIDGNEYIFAVGHGETWNVTIDQNGIPTAVVR
jgi:hypothetical protein